MTDRLQTLHLTAKEIRFLIQKPGGFESGCQYRNLVCDDGVSVYKPLTPEEIITFPDSEIFTTALTNQCPKIIDYLDNLALDRIVKNPSLFRQKTLKEAKVLWETLPDGYK
jgi:hypothetical protein